MLLAVFIRKKVFKVFALNFMVFDVTITVKADITFPLGITPEKLLSVSGRLAQRG
jgi:hypothetical protein